MDKLCGVGSLQVVYHKFSDGVQVVKCVLEFFKTMADVEQSYSQSIGRLVKSSAYTFHSNILMQWLGSDPFEEIGTVKRSWQQMGTELSLLADHHAHKAEGYLTPVRMQLQALLPQLEEMRLKLKNKMQQLKTSVEIAEKIHNKEKYKYNQIGETCLKLRDRLDEGEGQLTGAIRIKLTERKEAILTRDLEQQEKTYKLAHEDLVKIYDKFNRDIEELYREVDETERERVKTLKESLQKFAKTLSNTAPVYLESMGKIVISVDEIDASSDISSFVEQQTSLTEKLRPPPFEQHQAATLITPQPHEEEIPAFLSPQSKKETDSMLNGNRTPSERSQRSMSDDSAPHAEGVKGQGSEVNRKPKPLTDQVASRTPKQARPSVKPKPPPKKSESPFASSSSHVSNSSEHVTSSSSHVSNSSDHVTSSASRVSEAVNQMETIREPRPKRERHTVPNPATKHSKSKTANVKLPPISVLQQNAESARPRTNTTPSPTASPVSVRRRAHSAHASRDHADEDVVNTLERLQRLALTNDYYALLGVESSASQEELTRARREKSRLLHPDHFAGQPDRRLKAEEQLSRINQVFQDVLKNPDTRALYDRVCHFRKFYGRIPEQVRGLDKARSKLEDHRKLIKKAQFPLPVLEEMQLAVALIDLRMAKVPPEQN